VDQSKRPTGNKHEEIYKNENLNNNNNISHDSGGGSSPHKPHPDAYHISRILDDEIIKSQGLKGYTSNYSSLNDLDFNKVIQNCHHQMNIKSSPKSPSELHNNNGLKSPSLVSELHNNNDPKSSTLNDCKDNNNDNTEK